jgi:hypothetical protein
MSAGKPTTAVYEVATPPGTGRASITVQPETLALTIDGTANAGSSDPVNQLASVNAGGTRRETGISAYRVRLKWTGSIPDNYDPTGIITLPLLNAAIRAKASVKDAVGVYLSQPVQVVGVTPEYIN